MSGIFARITDRFRSLPDRDAFLMTLVCDANLELTLDRLRRMDQDTFAAYFGTGGRCREFTAKLGRRKLAERHRVYAVLFDLVRDHFDWLNDSKAKAFHIFCFDAFTLGSEDEFVMHWLASGNACAAFPAGHLLDAAALWLRNATYAADSFRIAQIFRSIRERLQDLNDVQFRLILSKLRDRTAANATTTTAVG